MVNTVSWRPFFDGQPGAVRRRPEAVFKRKAPPVTAVAHQAELLVQAMQQSKAELYVKRLDTLAKARGTLVELSEAEEGMIAELYQALDYAKGLVASSASEEQDDFEANVDAEARDEALVMIQSALSGCKALAGQLVHADKKEDEKFWRLWAQRALDKGARQAHAVSKRLHAWVPTVVVRRMACFLLGRWTA